MNVPAFAIVAAAAAWADLCAPAAAHERFLRLGPDVIAAFRADGPGWQSCIDDALRKATGLP